MAIVVVVVVSAVIVMPRFPVLDVHVSVAPVVPKTAGTEPRRRNEYKHASDRLRRAQSTHAEGHKQ
jgi:hypothetical protein